MVMEKIEFLSDHAHSPHAFFMEILDRSFDDSQWEIHNFLTYLGVPDQEEEKSSLGCFCYEASLCEIFCQ